jgi:hypothetical protein
MRVWELKRILNAHPEWDDYDVLTYFDPEEVEDVEFSVQERAITFCPDYCEFAEAGVVDVDTVRRIYAERARLALEATARRRRESQLEALAKLGLGEEYLPR